MAAFLTILDLSFSLLQLLELFQGQKLQSSELEDFLADDSALEESGLFIELGADIIHVV